MGLATMSAPAGGVRWGWVTVAVVLVAAIGAGCGNGAGDRTDAGDEAQGGGSFPADVDALATAARASAAEPHRVTLLPTRRVDRERGVTVEPPLLTGEQAGEAFELDLDLMGWLTSPIHPERFEIVESADTDMAVHLVGDGTALYVRAPLLAEMADASDEVDLGPFVELATLGERWGRADLAALREAPVATLGRLADQPSSIDPQAVLGLLAAAERVEPAGNGQVEGSPVTCLRAVVRLGDLIEAQGSTPLAFARGHAVSLGATADAPGLDAFMAGYVNTEIPLLVKVDERDRVRSVDVEVDVIDMIRAADPESDGLADAERFAPGVIITFSDYGDDGIDIQAPTDAIDAAAPLQRSLDGA